MWVQRRTNRNTMLLIFVFFKGSSADYEIITRIFATQKKFSESQPHVAALMEKYCSIAALLKSLYTEHRKQKRLSSIPFLPINSGTKTNFESKLIFEREVSNWKFECANSLSSKWRRCSFLFVRSFFDLDFFLPVKISAFNSISNSSIVR